MSSKTKKRNTRKRSGKSKSGLLQVRARTAEARRKRLLHISSFLIPLLAVIVAGWLIFAGGRVLFKEMFATNRQYIIRELDAQSDGRLTPELIAQYAGIGAGTNLFSVDLDDVRENLENVPIVKEAEIVRDLPDRVRIRITERVPLGIVKDTTGRYSMTVDRKGYLLTPALRKKGLPTISGHRIGKLKPGLLLDRKLFQDALQILDLCDRTRLSKFLDVENVDISDTSTLEVRLTTGEYAILPRRKLREKLIDLANILNDCRLHGRKLAKVDLTVENVAPAIEYR